MRHPVALVLAATLLANTASAAILCQKKSGAIFVREACKKKETAVAPSTLGLQVAIQGSCPPGQAAQSVGVDGALVCAATVPEGSVTSDEIGDVTRTIVLPARTISFNPIGGITPENGGVRYPLDNVTSAVSIPRPSDWDGASDVTIRILFDTESSNLGDVQFYLRPRIYDSGDPFTDVVAHLTDRAAMTGTPESFHEVRVTIPADAFGTKAWWNIGMQRQDDGEGLYPDGVVVHSLAIEYTAVR